jgi:hypothetical protein
MTKTAKFGTAWNSGNGKLLILWFGLDGMLYLGALLALVMALTDPSARPYAYGFTIALVISWASRMGYGIWLELRRLHKLETEKARKLNEILQKHGLSEEQTAAVVREMKDMK